MFYLPFMFICTFQRKAAFSSINISVLFGAFFLEDFYSEGLPDILLFFFISCLQTSNWETTEKCFFLRKIKIYIFYHSRRPQRKRDMHTVFFSQYLPQKEEYVCHFYFESAALKALDKKDFIVPFIENYFCYPLGRECFFPSIWENSQKEMN